MCDLCAPTVSHICLVLRFLITVRGSPGHWKQPILITLVLSGCIFTFRSTRGRIPLERAPLTLFRVLWDAFSQRARASVRRLEGGKGEFGKNDLTFLFISLSHSESHRLTKCNLFLIGMILGISHVHSDSLHS